MCSVHSTPQPSFTGYILFCDIPYSLQNVSKHVWEFK